MNKLIIIAAVAALVAACHRPYNPDHTTSQTGYQSTTGSQGGVGAADQDQMLKSDGDNDNQDVENNGEIKGSDNLDQNDQLQNNDQIEQKNDQHKEDVDQDNDESSPE